MFSSTLQFTLAKFLYPLSLPSHKRTKTLQLICLGLPRSGTESLRNALIKLGYDHVSHGIDFWANHANHSVLYAELALLRDQGTLPTGDVLREVYFDHILGDCEATTDIPSVWFAHELLAAYPDAKVILNRRNDVKAWKRSFRDSVQPLLDSWKYWLHSWFDAELFWGIGLSVGLHTQWLFRGDFERNAECAYVEHYESLEKVLDRAGRPYLKWGVEDGWEPLCQYLNKAVPPGKFPKGNIASDFRPKLMLKDRERFANARFNAVLLTSFLLVPAAFIWWAAR